MSVFIRRSMRHFFSVWGVLACCFLLAPRAEASFMGAYALGNFNLKNTSVCALDIPNGSAATPDNGLSVVLTGSNSGSGCPGATDLTATASGAGVVNFNYSYFSADAPMADFAGYLVGNSFTQLADTTGASGNVMFSVTSGQSFGFRVGTQDNTGGPGVLTVFGFNAPGGGGGTVPEPGTWMLLALGATAIFAIRREGKA